MITYPRLLPAQITYVTQGFGVDGHETDFPGFNRKSNFQVHAGGLNDRHVGRLTTPHLIPANFRVMRAWLQSLRAGRTFEVYDTDRKQSSHYTASSVTVDSSTITCDSSSVTSDAESLPGTGRVDGNQSGRTLVSKSWNNSADLHDAGDTISIAGHIYTVLEDAASDASGAVTYMVDPVLKNVLDGQAIRTRRAHMIAQLQGGGLFLETDNTKSGSISFAFEEVL